MDISNFRACGWSTVALDRNELARAQDVMRANHPGEPLVLSCQRLEAYGTGQCDCDAPARWHGREAVVHLAEVAAGLHSAVLGEAQILGQVRAGFAGVDGDVRRLGDVAIAAARDLRRKTAFNSHAGHLLDRALAVASVSATGRILVLGTGQMGRLVAERAGELGFESVVVAGRRPPDSLPATFVPLAGLRTLGAFDVVAGCLGSGASELALADLPPAALYVDLGTPRNFGHATAAAVEARKVIAIADLLADEARRPHARRRRASLQRELGAILDERLAALADDSASLVGALRARVEAVRRRELARIRRLHPEVPEATLEAMTRSLVNQLFHTPTRRLREADPAAGRAFLALFD